MIRALMLLLFLLACLQVAYYYPQLPEYVASNFAGSGEAQAWTPKRGFFVFSLGILGMIVLLFMGLKALMLKLPASLINIPNRDYWFAPERKAQSISFLGKTFGWIGVGTLAFSVIVLQMVIDANLTDPPRLSSAFLVVFAVYMVGMLGTVGWLVRYFFRTPNA